MVFHISQEVALVKQKKVEEKAQLLGHIIKYSEYLIKCDPPRSEYAPVKQGRSGCCFSNLLSTSFFRQY
jgi:hypothetical protein